MLLLRRGDHRGTDSFTSRHASEGDVPHKWLPATASPHYDLGRGLMCELRES
jgi:hypothetical protein